MKDIQDLKQGEERSPKARRDGIIRGAKELAPIRNKITPQEVSGNRRIRD